MYTSIIDINNPNITKIIDVKTNICIGHVFKQNDKYIAISSIRPYKRSQPLRYIEIARLYLASIFYKRPSTGLNTSLNVKQLNLLL